MVDQINEARRKQQTSAAAAAKAAQLEGTADAPADADTAAEQQPASSESLMKSLLMNSTVVFAGLVFAFVIQNMLAEDI